MRARSVALPGAYAKRITCKACHAREARARPSTRVHTLPCAHAHAATDGQHDARVRARFLGERKALAKALASADAADERAIAALGTEGFTAGASPGAALFGAATAAPRDGQCAAANEAVAAAFAAVADGLRVAALAAAGAGGA